MGIEIKRAPEAMPIDDKYVKVSEPIYLNGNKSKVVKADSSEASFVLAAKNGLLSLTDAKRYGIEYLFDLKNDEPVVVQFPEEETEEELNEEEEEVNEVLSAYYQEGHNAGRIAGYELGYFEGFKSGFDKGFNVRTN